MSNTTHDMVGFVTVTMQQLGIGGSIRPGAAVPPMVLVAASGLPGTV
ncbi:MAG: hypothetical protein ACRDTD_04725 [Pseudonocardiaceae bacterium]